MYQYKRWKYRSKAIVVEAPKDPTPVVLFLGTFLYFAAIVARVEPLQIPLAMMFVGASAAAAVTLLTAAAFLAVAVRDTGFGEFRHAVQKFLAVYLLSGGVGLWTGGWLGGALDGVFFLVLVMWLFGVDWVDAVTLSLFNVLLYVAVTGCAAFVLFR